MFLKHSFVFYTTREKKQIFGNNVLCKVHILFCNVSGFFLEVFFFLINLYPYQIRAHRAAHENRSKLAHDRERYRSVSGGGRVNCLYRVLYIITPVQRYYAVRRLFLCSLVYNILNLSFIVSFQRDTMTNISPSTKNPMGKVSKKICTYYVLMYYVLLYTYYSFIRILYII